MPYLYSNQKSISIPSLYSNQNIDERAAMLRFRNRLIVILASGLYYSNFGLGYRKTSYLPGPHIYPARPGYDVPLVHPSLRPGLRINVQKFFPNSTMHPFFALE